MVMKNNNENTTTNDSHNQQRGCDYHHDGRLEWDFTAPA
jgi:hypothetical protein